MSQALRDVIPVMNLIQEIREKGFEVVCTEPYVYDTAKFLKITQVLWNSQDFLNFALGQSISMYATIIFANMYARGLLKYSLLTQKTRLLMHSPKLWHKMTSNVIAATCVASDLPKLPT